MHFLVLPQKFQDLVSSFLFMHRLDVKIHILGEAVGFSPNLVSLCDSRVIRQMVFN